MVTDIQLCRTTRIHLSPLFLSLFRLSQLRHGHVPLYNRAQLSLIGLLLPLLSHQNNPILMVKLCILCSLSRYKMTLNYEIWVLELGHLPAFGRAMLFLCPVLGKTLSCRSRTLTAFGRAMLFLCPMLGKMLSCRTGTLTCFWSSHVVFVSSARKNVVLQNWDTYLLLV